MRRGRVIAALSATALAAAALTATTATSSAQPSTAVTAKGTATGYLVLTKKGADADAVAAALTKQGATVRSINRKIGLISVSSTKSNFRTTGKAISGVSGVAADRSIGKAPDRKISKVERENLTTKGAKGQAAAKAKPAKTDPLDGDLWGMRHDQGRPGARESPSATRRVSVGIMDTGVHGRPPRPRRELRPQACRATSPTDMPDIDGPPASSRAASTRRTTTTTVTAPTSPAPSPPR